MASWWSTDGVLDSLDLEENSIVSRVIQAVGLFGDILSLEDTMEPMLSKVRGDGDGDEGTAPGDEQMVESFQETKDEEKVMTEEEDKGEKEENEGDQEAEEWKNKNESKEEEKEDVDWMWKAQTQGQQEKERREEDRTEEEDRSTESDKDEEKRLKEDNNEVLQEVGRTVEEEVESEKDTGRQDEEEMVKNEDQRQSEEEEMEEKEKDVMKEEKYNDREKEKEEEVDEERKNQERSTVEEEVEGSEDMDEEVKKEKETTEIKGHEHHTEKEEMEENKAEEVEKENKREVDGTEGEMETAAGREGNAEDEEEEPVDKQENQLSQSESQNSSPQSQRQDLDFAEALSHDVETESGADRVLTDEEKGSVTAKDHGGDIYPTSPSKDKECEGAFLSSSDASAQTASESATDTHLPSVDARLHCADPAGPSDVQSETEDHGRDTTPELHTDLLASSLMDAAAQSSTETRPGNKELSPAKNASSTGNTAMETKDKEEGGQNSPQMNGEMDDKNNGSRQSLKYKTVSYRRIRKGNTKQRIDEFEAMMNS